MATIAHIITLTRALTADRARLAMENAALRQQVESGEGVIISTPVLCGLHHTYRRAA